MEGLFAALKYGALGLAAIVAVHAGYLLQTALRQPKLTKGHRTMFETYIGVCMILVIVCALVAYFENPKMASIRESVGRLDENELQKYEAAGPNMDPSAMRVLVKRMCGTLIEIAEQANGKAKHCQEVKNKPD
jgi:hypothetical protein